MGARDEGIAHKIRYALALVPATDYRASARKSLHPESSTVKFGASPYMLTTEVADFLTENMFGGPEGLEAKIADWRCSPIVGDLKGLPKMTIMTAGHDFLLDE